MMHGMTPFTSILQDERRRPRAAPPAAGSNRPRTTDRAAMRRLVLFAVAAACFGTARGEWQNLTVFHTNQANYSAGDIADMNTADDLVSARPRPALSAPQIACLAGSSTHGRYVVFFFAARRVRPLVTSVG